ncbi:single-strand DNA endonuclease ASTE1-like [Ptychodera flava]|uniref:single-strand DNA endonuclease ASTE1-like n=1 Tax=Ptychodera flava TaxID=63121 RepID=UPI00396A1941
MGVFGLTQFVKRDSSLLRSLLLHDTRAIVDGNGLVHWLCYGTGVDCVHGGDYQDFEDVCFRFFGSLQSCNVKPLVLIDGAVDFDGGKLETLKSRAEQKIKRSLGISRGSGGKIMPPFAFEIFLQTMRKLSIPYIVCDFEADNEIVALANDMGCPVIAEDSDFFIFDITSGYIPRSNLDWRNPRQTQSSTTGQAIHAEIFYLDRFCEKYSITKESIPILACLLGNDYIQRGAFDSFVREKVRKEHGRYDGDINIILRWLARQSDFESTKASMLDSADGITRHTLQTALALYQVQSESVFGGYLDGRSPIPRITIDEFPELMPEWYSEVCRTGKLPATVINTMVQHWHITNASVEDIEQPSCNNVSLPIRKVFYGIILKRPADEAESTEHELHKIEEFNRDSTTLKSALITPTPSLERYGALPSLADIPSIHVTDRKNIILETLGIVEPALERVQEEIKLPVAVTIYWIKNANPRIFANHVHALLMCFLRGYFEAEQSPKSELDDFSTEYTLKEESSTVSKVSTSPSLKRSAEQSLLSTSARKMTKKFRTVDQLLEDVFQEREQRIDLRTVQAYAQWQSCMQHANYLNTVLQGPFHAPEMTKLYKGTLIHKMCSVLESKGKYTDLYQWIKTKLGEIPNATGMYQTLYSTVTDQTGELRKNENSPYEGRHAQGRMSKSQSHRDHDRRVTHHSQRKQSASSWAQSSSREHWTAHSRTVGNQRSFSQTHSRDDHWRPRSHDRHGHPGFYQSHKSHHSREAQYRPPHGRGRWYERRNKKPY